MADAGKTILAVDDEQDITEMLVLLLESEGYRMLTASGGQEALDILEKERPDLVLLDIMMPDVDGHQVCRYIRSRPELASLPVLMLTAKNDIAHIAQSVDEGADGFIVKPFDVDHFLRVLQFRIAGGHAEFYRSDRPVELAKVKKDDLTDGYRIVFLDLLEPAENTSRVIDACQEQCHCVLSFWQQDAGEGLAETTVLLGVESSAQFGDLLNGIMTVPEVRPINCTIFRDFADIPTDIMHGGD